MVVCLRWIPCKLPSHLYQYHLYLLTRPIFAALAGALFYGGFKEETNLTCLRGLKLDTEVWMGHTGHGILVSCILSSLGILYLIS